MATFEECAAAAEAVGWDVTTDEVDQAVSQHKGKSLHGLRNDLQVALLQFEQNGARGVDLANEIDALRIAVAVRAYQEANG